MFRASSLYGTRTTLDYFEIASFRKKIYTVSIETVQKSEVNLGKLWSAMKVNNTEKIIVIAI